MTYTDFDPHDLGYRQGGWRAGSASARRGSVRWEILDASLNRSGEFTPARGAQIRVDQDGNVRRRLSGLVVPSPDIDPAADRIRPVWVDHTETNLGVYRIASAEVADAGVEITAADESVRLLANISRTVSLRRGYTAQQIAETLAGHLSIPSVRVDPTTEELGEPMSWALGEASWSDIAEKASAAVGMLAPWFDRDGTWRWQVAPDFDTQPPDWTYTLDGGVVLGGLERSVTLLDEPNVWYAVNPQAAAPIVGRHALGGHWPNSVANVGYEQPELVEVGGLRTKAAADNAARAAAAQHVSDVGAASLEVPFDPGHDLYETAEVDGYLYRVTGWSHRADGGTMGLDLNRLYRATDTEGAHLAGSL